MKTRRMAEVHFQTAETQQRNLFTVLWRKFSSFDQFTKSLVIVFLLVLLATPFITAHYLIFRPHAQQGITAHHLFYVADTFTNVPYSYYDSLANPVADVSYRVYTNPTNLVNFATQQFNTVGRKYYATAASSDFQLDYHLTTLYVPYTTLQQLATQSMNQGYYIHELMAQIGVNIHDSTGKWDEAKTVASVDWNWMDQVVALAKANNQKVLWNDPATYWNAILNDSNAKSHIASYGTTLVLLFPVNFGTGPDGTDPQRPAVSNFAQQFGLQFGESHQDWYFYDQHGNSFAWMDDPANASLVQQQSYGLAKTQAWDYGARYFQYEVGDQKHLLQGNPYMNGIADFSNYLATLASTPTPTAPSSTTTTLNAVADTYVASDSPNGTNGGAPYMYVGGGTVSSIAYLKFDLSSLAGKTFTAVSLRINTLNNSDAGSSSTQSVKYVSDNSWSESAMAYNTHPAVSTVLGSIANTKPNTQYNISLTPASIQQTAGGTLSLAMDASVADLLEFYSKESGTPPQLIVTYNGSITVTPTPSSSPSPTPTLTATVSPSPSPSPTPSPTPVPSSATINANADTYVQSESQKNVNGSAPYLYVTGGSYTNIAYMKFSIPSLSGQTITAAKLRITTLNNSDAGSSSTQSVNYVNNNSWSESTMNYKNKPSISSTIMGTISNTQPHTTYDIPLSSLSNIQSASGDQFTIALMANQGDLLEILSKESGTTPQLIITFK